jgi:hypothetical protein
MYATKMWTNMDVVVINPTSSTMTSNENDLNITIKRQVVRTDKSE